MIETSPLIPPPPVNPALQCLDDLIAKYFEILKRADADDIKLGDWLKMIELRHKLQPDESSQTRLWEKIESIRREVLAHDTPASDHQPAPSPNQSTDPS